MAATSIFASGILKAAIVAPPHEGSGQRVAPLGAMAVAAYVEQELEGVATVDVFDCDDDDPNGVALLERLADSDVKVVGFQIFSSQVSTVLRWAKRFKARLPGAILVAGGHHPTLTWSEFILRHGGVFDCIVKGDGEVPFTEIVRRVAHGQSVFEPPIPSVGHLSAGGTAVISCAQEPIAIDKVANMLSARLHGRKQDLIFSDLSTGQKRKAVAITSSRSCPLECSFCSIITMPGKWRANESQTVVQWLKESYASSPFEHVYFMDANFFVVPRRVREIARDLAASFPNVTWSASSTVRMLLRMEKDMSELVASGLRMVELGIESGSTRQLKILNKEVTVEENHRAVALLHRHKLQIGLDFIMFFPDQTPNDLKENLTFLEEANLVLERSWDHYLNTLELYPGTPLRDIYANAFDLKFDCDTLPKAEDLFSDPTIRRVHKLFVHEFAPRWLPEIDRLYGRLLGAAHLVRPHDPDKSSRFVLEAVALRRLPLRLLWDLVDSPGQTLTEAAPWLKNAQIRFDEVDALTADTVRLLNEAA